MPVERVYTINLRKELIETPRWRRANRAIKLIREFVQRHMKSDKIKLDQRLNEKIWERSGKKPVMKLRIKVKKDDDGTVHVTLFEEGTGKGVQQTSG